MNSRFRSNSARLVLHPSSRGLLLLGWLFLAPGLTFAEEVICPAATTPPRYPGSCSVFDLRLVDEWPAVVVGCLTKSETGLEITVERVLYGDPALSRARLSGDSGEEPAGRRVYFMTRLPGNLVEASWLGPDDPGPHRSKEQTQTEFYTLVHDLPASEEAAEVLVSSARFDYRVLAADYIFVGQTLAYHGDRLVDIAIEAVLSGRLEGRAAKAHYTGSLSLPAGSALFLADKPEHGDLIVREVWPTSLQTRVLDALARRESYPMVEIAPGSVVREVLFQGSITQAIDLLGSVNEAAVLLGWRRLAFERTQALPAVTDAIRSDLLSEASGTQRFRRQRNLISFLAEAEDEDSQREIQTLIEALLRVIEADQLSPPGIGPQWRRYHQSEDSDEDNNHSLLWLLSATDEAALLSSYADRLLRIRDQDGRWKQEIQTVLDVCQVEDSLELRAALSRGMELKPDVLHTMRRPEGMGSLVPDLHSTQPLTWTYVGFSSDGAQLCALSGHREAWFWSLQAPRLGKMVAAPQGYRFASIRDDWRYALCAPLAEPQNPPIFDWSHGVEQHLLVEVDGRLAGEKGCNSAIRSSPRPSETARVLVMELQSRKIVSEAFLPSGFGGGWRSVYWLADDHVLIDLDRDWYKFDALTGKGIGPARLAEPGRTLHRDQGKHLDVLRFLDTRLRSEEFRVFAVDPVALTLEFIGEGRKPAFTGNDAGSVPGIRHFYLASPGMHIFHWDSFDHVMSLDLRGWDCSRPSFSRTGDRFVLRGRRTRRVPAPWLRSWRVRVEPRFLRIHETATGTTLFALEGSFDGPVALSPDGQAVAAVMQGGQISLWKLPG